MAPSRTLAARRKSTSIWTFRAASALAAIALSACGADFAVTRKAPDKIVVSGTDFVVAGPPGYCIDRSLSKDRGENAFVMMGSCASISGRLDRPTPAAPAVLTVAISPEIGLTSVPVSALKTYVQTQSGRAALSRTGRAAEIQVIETHAVDGVLFIHARDSATISMAGFSDTFWRALFPLNGRLVTASVVRLESRPISRDAGFATAQELAGRLKRENAAMARQVVGDQRS